jgi:hypothetical protein
MQRGVVPRRRSAIGAAVLVPAVALAGCGSTQIDSTKAANLIKSDVNSSAKVKRRRR